MIEPGAGSPPRVRGEERHSRRPCPGCRITPACAGRSGLSIRRTIEGEDHPRVCGEKRFAGISAVSSRGSPPRVRGEETACRDAARALRITPACAGRRTFWKNPAEVGEDHPRVCGEKRAQDRQTPPRVGSPPRVRGEDCLYQLPHRISRITPACAGRSGGRRPDAARKPDHPRVCGEKVYPGCADFNAEGSPPRVRGEVPDGGLVDLRRRITPACAGRS